jgi:hypothetical protein
MKLGMKRGGTEEAEMHPTDQDLSVGPRVSGLRSFISVATGRCGFTDAMSRKRYNPRNEQAEK